MPYAVTVFETISRTIFVKDADSDEAAERAVDAMSDAQIRAIEPDYIDIEVSSIEEVNV